MLAASAPAAPQENAAPVYTTDALNSVRYPLSVVNDSGIGGSVLVADYGLGATVVTIAVRGTLRDGAGGAQGGEYPVRFRVGDCGSDTTSEDGAVTLNGVERATGLSVTTVDAPYDALVGEDYALELLSPDGSSSVACGEVGSGAN